MSTLIHNRLLTISIPSRQKDKVLREGDAMAAWIVCRSRIYIRVRFINKIPLSNLWQDSRQGSIVFFYEQRGY